MIARSEIVQQGPASSRRRSARLARRHSSPGATSLQGGLAARAGGGRRPRPTTARRKFARVTGRWCLRRKPRLDGRVAPGGGLCSGGRPRRRFEHKGSKLCQIVAKRTLAIYSCFSERERCMMSACPEAGAPVASKPPAAARSQRLARFKREQLIVDYLNRGVSVVEIQLSRLNEALLVAYSACRRPRPSAVGGDARKICRKTLKRLNPRPDRPPRPASAGRGLG